MRRVHWSKIFSTYKPFPGSNIDPELRDEFIWAQIEVLSHHALDRVLRKAKNITQRVQKMAKS